MRITTTLLVAVGISACGGAAQEPAAPTVVPAEPSSEPAAPSESPQPVVIADAPSAAPSGQWDVYPREGRPTVIAESPPSRPPAYVDGRILPEDFRVYVRGSTVINHPQPGFDERVLPTVNDFRGEPGCYVACYSHDARRGVYGVGGSIYVMGQVRVPGHYEGRVCLPDRYGRSDISAAQGIKELCKASIPACGDGCWGGGDTGGWFGVR